MRRTLLVAALLAAAPLATAHAQAAAQPQPMTQAEAEARVRAEVQKVRQRLQLKPEQTEQLRTLFREEITKLDSIDLKAYDDMVTVAGDYQQRMRNVLDAKQQAEWDKIKAEYREKFVQRQRQRRAAAAS